MPGGETLKDVYARVVPYFEQEILPKLQNGENILLVAHGNSIRALIKHLDQVPEAEMANVEMPLVNYWFIRSSPAIFANQKRSIVG